MGETYVHESYIHRNDILFVKRERRGGGGVVRQQSIHCSSSIKIPQKTIHSLNSYSTIYQPPKVQDIKKFTRCHMMYLIVFLANGIVNYIAQLYRIFLDKTPFMLIKDKNKNIP